MKQLSPKHDLCIAVFSHRCQEFVSGVFLESEIASHTFMKQVFLLLLTAVAFYSCHSRDKAIKKMAEQKYAGYEKIIKNKDSIPEITPGNDGLVTIRIPSDLSESGINLDEIMDSMYYIRLETDTNALIGDIDKLLFCDDVIVVIERIKRQSILLFSRQGKFMCRLGIQGRGPGEYLNFTDVAIDHRKKQIVVLDDRGEKLMYYDLGGHHIKDQRLLYFVENIAVLNDGSYLIGQARYLNRHLPSASDYALLFAEPDLNISGKSLSYTYRDQFPKNQLSSNHNFNPNRNGVWFNRLVTDTIYEISRKNAIHAKYCLDMGSKNITARLNEQTTTDDVFDMLNAQKYFYFKGKAFETNNYVYFEINANQCYYSKQKNKLYYGSFWKYKNEHLISHLIETARPETSDDHFFVAVLQPYSFMPNLKYKKLSPDLDPILADLKVDDNPVLFFYSLK